jgi:hypothetical protein
MSKRGTVIVLLLVVSEALGIALGEAGFRLYRMTMPPAAISGFNMGAAHGAYIFWGAVAGLGLAVWSLIAALLGRFAFVSKPAAPAPPAASATPRPGA